MSRDEDKKDTEEQEHDPVNTSKNEQSPTIGATDDEGTEEAAPEPVRLTVMSTATLRDFWDMTPEEQYEWAENLLNGMFSRKGGPKPRPPVGDGQDKVAEAGSPESDPESSVDHDENGPR
jgi:hypothetical protein